MKRRDLLATAGAAAAVGLSGCLAAIGGGDDQDYDVGMGDSVFEPEAVTVQVDETVRWRNTSGRAHSVTAYGNGIPEDAAFFASGGFGSTAAAREGWQAGEGHVFTGDTYEHAFEVAGEYNYFCVPHERARMVGTVVVEG